MTQSTRPDVNLGLSQVQRGSQACPLGGTEVSLNVKRRLQLENLAPWKHRPRLLLPLAVLGITAGRKSPFDIDGVFVFAVVVAIDFLDADAVSVQVPFVRMDEPDDGLVVPHVVSVIALILDLVAHGVSQLQLDRLEVFARKNGRPFRVFALLLVVGSLVEWPKFGWQFLLIPVEMTLIWTRY